MYRLWLIQRGQFKDTKFDDITGIDSLLSFEYMGSSEYEFGALPKSLRRIIEEGYSKYSFVEVDSVRDKDGNTARVYCKNNEVEDAIKAVIHLSENDYGYKERASMHKYIVDGYKDKPFTTDFWWDIENDFFVIFGNEKQKLLQKAISEMEIKWGVIPKKKKTFLQKLIK